jgi:hypothetical protein
MEKSYRDKLGYTLSGSITSLAEGNQPVWRFVSADDLTTEAAPNSARTAGLLLDPEIGVLLYLLPFDTETNVRRQLHRALALRSRLVVTSNAVNSTDQDDPRGSWRVVMNWLARTEDRERWIGQVMEMRRQTGFSEEVSLDAIFFSEGDLEQQFESHGFPRLLLTTRNVLKKPSLDQVAQWMSANNLVLRSLEGLAKHFRVPRQRELVAEMLKAVHDYQQSRVSREPPPESPKQLKKISIQDFRNLDDVRFCFATQPVSTLVIHGPNGTGKSSVCEAISLALFGSSFRFRRFVTPAEKDITISDRLRHYIEHYLSPIQRPNVRPRIGLNDGPPTVPTLVAEDQVDGSDVLMSGTILSQDASLEFARLSSNELALRVLRGYSDLAEFAEKFAETAFEKSNTGRQRFLRELGLIASITKLDTAYERIVETAITSLLPSIPTPLDRWLQRAVSLGIQAPWSSLHEQWQTWGGDSARKDLARGIAASRSEEGLRRSLAAWLLNYNELVANTVQAFKDLQSKMEPVHAEMQSAVNRVRIWGEWVERRSQMQSSSGSGEADGLAAQLKDLQLQQQHILECGNRAKGRVDHLQQTEAFLRQLWLKSNPDECPTCGANHSGHGGIQNVIESIKTQVFSEREALRVEYAHVKSRVEETQRRLSNLGHSQCPLAPEEQSRLSEILGWILPTAATLPDWIAVARNREQLSDTIKLFIEVPSAPTPIDSETETATMTHQLLRKFHEVESIFEEPNNWKQVKLTLTESLAEIVGKHLPNTVARLWCELALNVTAAPWLYPEKPCITVGVRKGDQQASIRIRDRLARYILNQSEIHILGLAWFFSRYFTHGRFYNASIVMDDPGNELDQTSFRDLCRLWETLVRLHRVYKIPVTFVLLLSQEGRALDAARATDGAIAVLGWKSEQHDSVQLIQLGEGFSAPSPDKLFRQVAS